MGDAGQRTREDAAIALLREAFRDDGAEGESAWLVCKALEDERARRELAEAAHAASSAEVRTWQGWHAALCGECDKAKAAAKLWKRAAKAYRTAWLRWMPEALQTGAILHEAIAQRDAVVERARVAEGEAAAMRASLVECHRRATPIGLASWDEAWETLEAIEKKAEAALLPTAGAALLAEVERLRGDFERRLSAGEELAAKLESKWWPELAALRAIVAKLPRCHICQGRHGLSRYVRTTGEHACLLHAGGDWAQWRETEWAPEVRAYEAVAAVAASLPTNAEDERIVDGLVAKRTAAMATRRIGGGGDEGGGE